MTYTHYVCLNVLFRVQVAGVSTGRQLVDEQHVLFRADSVEDAHRQLAHYAEQLAKPYLNSANRWVRWQFDSVIDHYESDLPGMTDFGETGGMEVFSTVKRRRRQPADYWAGPVSGVV